jgi:hypothetical protein
MKKIVVVIAIVLAVGGLFFYMTTAHATEECEVCMQFNARSNCAKAAGRTVQQATEGAHTTACGPLASGMNEQIACQRTPPVRIQCRTR